jgi:hypothetical protein
MDLSFHPSGHIPRVKYKGGSLMESAEEKSEQAFSQTKREIVLPAQICSRCWQYGMTSANTRQICECRWRRIRYVSAPNAGSDAEFRWLMPRYIKRWLTIPVSIL